MFEGVDSTLTVNGQKTFGVVKFEWIEKENTGSKAATSSA